MIRRDTAFLYCRHDAVDIGENASKFYRESRKIENGVRSPLVPISWLAYATRVNDDSLIEFGHSLLMSVAEDEYVGLISHQRSDCQVQNHTAVGTPWIGVSDKQRLPTYFLEPFAIIRKCDGEWRASHDTPIASVATL